MRADERHNAWKCTFGEGLFGIGMNLVAAVTVMPLLLKQLGAGETVVGLAFGIATAGWGLLQPIGLFAFGRRRRLKNFLVPWSLSSCVPTYLGMGLTVLFLGPTRPGLCVVLILALFSVRVLGGGMTVPLWFDWHALPIPDFAPPGPAFETGWSTLGPRIAERLAAGGRVFVHCRAGFGRSGTVAARLLLETGATPDPAAAIAAVRAARPGAIETDAQLAHLAGLARGTAR